MDEIINPAIPNNSITNSSPQVNLDKNKGSKKWLLIFAYFFVIILLIGGIVFTSNKNYKKTIVPNEKELPQKTSLGSTFTKQNEINTQIANSSMPISPQLFAGKYQKLSQNLDLLLLSSPKEGYKVIYYSAGTYTKGKYKGFTRYIVIVQEEVGNFIKFLASKDLKYFVLDSRTTSPPLFSSWDHAKVTSIDTLPTEHPETISLSNMFSLVKSELIGLGSTEVTLFKDFSSFPKLKSPISNLTIYGINTYSTTLPLLTPAPPRGFENFIDGTTTTYVVDSTGLSYSYSPTTPELASSYQQKINDYYKAQEESFLTPTIKMAIYTRPPEHPNVPDIFLKKENIKTNYIIFNSYKTAVPYNCVDNNTIMYLPYPNYSLVAKNLSNADLQKIGTSTIGDIFILKDKNHILNQTEYLDKITTTINYENQDPKYINKVFAAPTYNEYVNKNPLLFFKDPWDRWIMLGESDYEIPEYCGELIDTAPGP